ncbi:hypothetical protein [Microcoleus sp. herbarium12]|jgi:inosine-uridine nucleoside N-ribohydrolase|uniref:hypothetical protein n=1 Tax=Microcoleus sp. herbarium12 TaxID=3055437 RepID=UPI002FD609F2
MSKILVLMDRDGAVDDYLSVVLLMTMQEVETSGANCDSGGLLNSTCGERNAQNP